MRAAWAACWRYSRRRSPRAARQALTPWRRCSPATPPPPPRRARGRRTLVLGRRPSPVAAPRRARGLTRRRLDRAGGGRARRAGPAADGAARGIARHAAAGVPVPRRDGRRAAGGRRPALPGGARSARAGSAAAVRVRGGGSVAGTFEQARPAWAPQRRPVGPPLRAGGAAHGAAGAGQAAGVRGGARGRARRAGGAAGQLPRAAPRGRRRGRDRPPGRLPAGRALLGRPQGAPGPRARRRARRHAP